MLCVAAASAGTSVLDRILAVVGDEIILLSEVEEELALASVQGALDLSDGRAVAAARSQLLNQMVDERILLVQARREGIRVSRSEIDEAVDRAFGDLRSRFPSESAFDEQLRSEGLTRDTLLARYRDKIEDQLLVRQLVEREVRSDVEIPEGEVVAYWNENREDLPPIPASLDLSRIVLRTDPGGGDSTAVLRAERVLQRLQDGEDFAALATVFSEGPAASRGGELGRFLLADLAPPIASAVADLSADAVSGVVVTSRGAHILRVDAREGDMLSLRQIVFLLDEDASRASLRARAEALLVRLHAGEDFAELARTESAEAHTAASGGELGVVAVDALPPAYRTLFQELAPGGITDPLEEEGDLVIYRLNAVQGERPATLEEMHPRIEEYLRQGRVQEVLAAYVAEVREEIHIELRLTDDPSAGAAPDTP
ncbi:MAG: hypothetical protein CME07_04670 [Gemmatimonadetes bacterium]|nr:hypothetical protein [Gemmatimonadota bacterium]